MKAVLVSLILISSFLGTGLIIMGVAVPRIVNNKLNAEIKENLVVDSKDSTAYNRWESDASDDSAPFYHSFYFFHISNVKDVLNGAKPSLEQKGPYVYRRYQVRTGTPSF